MPLKHIYRYSISIANILIRIGRFVIIIAAFYILYKELLDQFFDGSKQVLPLLGLWLITAYAALPRVHHILTKYYLPNYFVGRVRSPSGLLSDPVNLAFFGDEKQIHKVMKAAGWKKADDLNPRTFLRAVVAVLLRRSYPTAPVGHFYLFNRKQDFAYEIEVNGSPNQRHHVRFWKTPDGWRLPGGHSVEWLAAATYDTHVGLKVATGQIDHLIHENIDVERDFIVASVEKTGLVEKVEIVKHFSDAFHDHNNGGDRIKTDGSLPFIYLGKSK